MKKEFIPIGSLDTIIEIVQFSEIQSETGMDSQPETIIGIMHSQRLNKSGGEEDEGKIRWLNERIYYIRFVGLILTAGVQMTVRDQDGDFDIHHVEPIGRKRWLKLKTSKRE